MIVNRAYRYELNPNDGKRILLAKHAGAARFAFNWGLARRVEKYERDKTSTNAIVQHRELNALKKTDFPWMYEVSKCAPQEALRDLDKAFKNFFRGLKYGQKIGFPKYKRKGINDSFRLTGAIHVKDKAVQLPRLGLIRLKEPSAVNGRILSATVRREANRWFVSLAVEMEMPEPQPVQGEAVGVDVGLNCFAACSDGHKEYAPKPLNKHLNRLKRYQCRVNRKIEAAKKAGGKTKGWPASNNLRKASARVAKIHCRIRNIRQDFLHKFSTSLAKTKSEIMLEDLNIIGMMRNHRLARHIADAGWGEFRRMLEYKTQWYGSKLTFTPRFFASSKTCCECGHVLVDMKLTVRDWKCPACGEHHDRDINAAKNLLNWGTASSAGI